MMDNVTLHLSVSDVDFIIQVLGSVPTLQTAQADKLHLIPKIRDQAQASLSLEKQQTTKGIEAQELRRQLDKIELGSVREG